MGINWCAKPGRFSFKCVSSSAARAFTLLIGAIALTAGNILAQDHSVPPEILNQPPDHRSAHVHNQDMSCCAPCAPETNQDPDVFKRPCFTRALAMSREGFDAYLGLTDAQEIRIPQETLSVEGVKGFEALLLSLLQPEFLPAAWQRANFQVPYPSKSVMEVREGITTFVGHAIDRTAVAANEISPIDPIQGAWTIGGIEVLPRTPKVVDRPTRATIRLRLRGDERLLLRPRPPDFQPGARRWREGWDYFDNLALNHLLKKAFQVPFDDPKDFVIKGHDSGYEGVRVFVGKILSREWQIARKSSDTNQSPPHWWDEMQLLVTDSDPQYFCVSITLGRDDVIPAPQP